MRIKKIELKNFKRFTDLTISEIPESAKLVLLIGSNGSGKSCLFDAFDLLYKAKIGALKKNQMNYYDKISSNLLNINLEFYSKGSISYADSNPYLVAGNIDLILNFYGRTSIRIIPQIIGKGNPNQIKNNLDKPDTFIENDTRFINDSSQYIENIYRILREPIFRGQQPDTIKVFSEFIAPINHSLLRIFGSDELTTIQIADFQDATLTDAAQIIFKKGDSKINYDLLSHGEKQVVILLINFIVRQEYYKDSIVFIDEMDCHLNTTLQTNLIHEIVTRWIPEDAQLWTASHALGFIDYAQHSDNACIIDFDLFNFDYKQEIIPSSKEKVEVYDVAIPKATITNILKNYKLVVVENKNDQYYNAALGDKGYLFLPANNNREVFLTIKNDKDKIGLRDRDYLRDDEIIAINSNYSNLKILPFYTFENLIYHPDNIDELKMEGFIKENYMEEIVKQKNEKLLEIIGEVGTSRSHYIEFKDGIKNDENIKPIIDSLKSNNLSDFYKFFNMKKHFNRTYMSQINIRPIDLVKTKWFEKIIIETLKR